MAAIASERHAQGDNAEDLIKEEVFKQTYIPQRLDEVRRIEPNLGICGSRVQM